MPPMDVVDWGRMAFLKDPGGAAIGLWQAGKHTGAGLVNEPGAFIWDEVLAPDTQAVVAFYGSVFGWTTEPMPIPGGGSYTMFKLGDAKLWLTLCSRIMRKTFSGSNTPNRRLAAPASHAGRIPPMSPSGLCRSDR